VIKGSSFTINKANQLVSATQADLSVIDTSIESNSAGTCIQANDYSAVTIRGTQFRNNTATGIEAGGESQLIVSLSDFFDNHSPDTLIVLQNTQAFPALFMNSNFAGNTAITSLIQLRNAQMEIKACKFNDNYANLIAHGFVLYQSSLIAKSLSFNQSGERITGSQPISGAFFLSAGSSLQLLDGSVIQKTSGQVASAVYLESDSSMLATKATFANMKISEAVLS